MQKILIIDDDGDLLEILESAFSELGIVPICLRDPDVALEVIHESKVAAVLCDIVMAPWDGIRLVHRIKSIRPNLLVFVMSGYHGKIQSHSSLEVADGIFPKPFRLETVVTTIAKALEAAA